MVEKPTFTTTYLEPSAPPFYGCLGANKTGSHNFKSQMCHCTAYNISSWAGRAVVVAP